MENSTEIILAIIGIYSLLLIVFGTIANSFSIVVCMRQKLRNVPTFVFYAFLLVSDTLSLYVWNLDHYLLKFHEYQLEDLGLHMCRFVTLWQLFAFQSSAWILVAMTLERYMSVHIKTWRLIFKPKHAVLTTFCINTIILVINIKFTVAITYDNGDNSTFDSNITCFGADHYNDYMQQNNYTYCLLPFLAMTIINLLLFYELNYRKETTQTVVTSSNNKSKRKAISYTVLMLSVLFMILTLPDSIANAFYVPYLFETRDRIAILFFLDCIAFTFHSFNFIALAITNKQFSRELKTFFRTFRKGTLVEPMNSSLTRHITTSKIL